VETSLGGADAGADRLLLVFPPRYKVTRPDSVCLLCHRDPVRDSSCRSSRIARPAPVRRSSQRGTLWGSSPKPARSYGSVWPRPGPRSTSRPDRPPARASRPSRSKRTKNNATAWPVPELDGWATNRGVDSGTGKGTTFRAFSAGFRYSGGECRKGSFVGRRLWKRQWQGSASDRPRRRRPWHTYESRLLA
jgi:hypothetical protein